MPIAAAHILLTDADPHLPIPDLWKDETSESRLRFDAVDILFLSPFLLKPNGDFFIEQLDEGKDFVEKRLEFMRDLARRKNPNIKIFAQQWWDHHDYETLEADKVDTHADAVAKVIEKYDLDGYDCDYEPRQGYDIGGNVVDLAPAILKSIRTKLTELGKKHNRRYYVSVSPSRVNYLDGLGGTLHKEIDFVNMQTYSGGSGRVTVKDLTGKSFGYKKSQLLWGVESETPALNEVTSLPTIKNHLIGAGKDNHLVGFHLWRLTSDPAFTNRVQLYLWQVVHGKPIDAQFEQKILADWKAKVH